jgi:hypothetical protein
MPTIQTSLLEITYLDDGPQLARTASMVGDDQTDAYFCFLALAGCHESRHVVATDQCLSDGDPPGTRSFQNLQASCGSATEELRGDFAGAAVFPRLNSSEMSP